MTGFQLRDYQIPHAERALVELSRRGVFLDDSETGTGKTYVALWVAKYLGTIPLVIGPKTTKISWLRAAEIAGVELEYVNYEKVRGTRNKETGVSESEWVWEIPCGKGSKVEFKERYEMIIFDEVHRCGGMTSLNSKVLIAAGRACRYLMLLSATAIDDPRQMKALGRVLGLYDYRENMGFTGWLLKHGCKPGVFGGFDLVKNRTKLDEAFAKIRDEIFPDGRHGLRRREIPTFPQTRLETVLLEADGKALKLAGEIEALYKFRDEQRELAEATQSVLEEIIRKRQMLEALKIPDLVELASTHGRRCPVALFVSFVDTVDILADKLSKVWEGASVGIIDGRQIGVAGEKARQDVIDKFQANKLQFVVVNAAAGGEGISLHDPTGRVERVSLITPIPSGRRLVQILGRPHRDGGAFSLQLLVSYANTYEQKIADTVIRKVKNLEILNDSDLLC